MDVLQTQSQSLRHCPISGELLIQTTGYTAPGGAMLAAAPPVVARVSAQEREFDKQTHMAELDGASIFVETGSKSLLRCPGQAKLPLRNYLLFS